MRLVRGEDGNPGDCSGAVGSQPPRYADLLAAPTARPPRVHQTPVSARGALGRA